MPPSPVTDFDAFAARQLPRLAQVADVFTADRVEADRVVVDAFVSMYRTWPSLVDGQDRLAAARRRLTVAYRRSARFRGKAEQQAALELADDFGAPSDIPRGADAIWEAVLDLAPRDRAILVWRLLEHLPDTAVAQTVGLPPHLIARRVRRGLDHVGMTVGLTAEDEIAGRQDADSRDRVAAEVAAAHNAGPGPGRHSSRVLPRCSSSSDWSRSDGGRTRRSRERRSPA